MRRMLEKNKTYRVWSEGVEGLVQVLDVNEKTIKVQDLVVNRVKHVDRSEFQRLLDKGAITVSAASDSNVSKLFGKLIEELYSFAPRRLLGGPWSKIKKALESNQVKVSVTDGDRYVSIDGVGMGAIDFEWEYKGRKGEGSYVMEVGDITFDPPGSA